MAKDNSSGGCGCLLLIFIAVIGLTVGKCKGTDEYDSNKQSTESYVSSSSSYVQREPEFTEEERMFLDNSLSTGDTPYSEYYGSNYMCTRSQCSAIEVTAPTNSDIVVIIKRDNDRGSVISHAYIRAGRKYSFDLPNGTYQPFFYYGEGWNPNKDMGNGIKGGFVKDESFSKDNPQSISDCVLSYVLQLQKDGNFQTKGSNRREMF